MSELLVPLGFTVVSPDGLSLGSDPGVRAIIALLGWLHRPDDVSSAHAAQALWALRTATDHAAPFDGMLPDAWLRGFLRQHTGIDTRAPLVGLILHHRADHRPRPATNAFVLGLVNEAHAFVIEHGDRPPSRSSMALGARRGAALGGRHRRSARHPRNDGARQQGLQFPVVIASPYRRRPPADAANASDAMPGRRRRTARRPGYGPTARWAAWVYRDR